MEGNLFIVLFIYFLNFKKGGPGALFSLNLKKKLYWSGVDLQSGISFRCRAKWFRSICEFRAQSLQSCLTLCDPVDCSSPSFCLWDSPGKNIGVGCHALLQRIFPAQGLNPSHVSCIGRWVLYHLASSGQPRCMNVYIFQILFPYRWSTVPCAIQ